MNIANTKSGILAYLASITDSFSWECTEPFMTNTIADKSYISRNLASQYLNELVKEHKVIKISSRPVLFLHKRSLENLYQIQLQMDEFLSYGEFQSYIKERVNEQSYFLRLQGHASSMKYVINQAKSAISYPPNGLWMIFTGKSGTGKTMMSEILYQYALDLQVFPARSELRHMYLKAEKKETSIENLSSFDGILCIHNAQYLDWEKQQILRQLFHHNHIEGKLFVILCSEHDLQSVFDPSFLQMFPVVCQFPDLEERGIEEKEAYLFSLLKKEEKQIQKAIYISSGAQRVVCRHLYPSNFIDMKKTIKTALANALLEAQDKNEVDLQIYHLPKELISNMEFKEYEENHRICVHDYLPCEESNKALHVFEKILGMFSQNDHTKALQQAYQILKEYYDSLIFAHKYQDERIKAIELSLQTILHGLDRGYRIKLPMNCSFVLARLIYLFANKDAFVEKWLLAHEELITNCCIQLQNLYPNEAYMVSRIEKLIHTNMDIKLQQLHRLLLMIYLSHFDMGEQRRYLGVIISHGYATASSIADAANTLLGQVIFDAIDMPLNVSIQQVIGRMEAYLNDLASRTKVILMVDMGSLETIGEELSVSSSQSVGVINNVSTRLALEVGSGILQGKEMEDILQHACEGISNSYRIMDVAQKKQAIIFTSESGTAMAERMMKLFTDSLPKQINVECMTYDFDKLSAYGKDNACFETHQVLFLTGTMDPKIKDVNFVALEDIVALGNIGAVERELSLFLDQKELEAFNHKLLINFSLQNVIENITILNPSRLLTSAAEAIDLLESLVGIPFDNRLKIALYIHVSCLIERLITHTVVEMDRKDYSLFIQEQGEFIEKVTDSFMNITRYYKVELSMNEMLYLYEYIVKDEKEIKKYRGK